MSIRTVLQRYLVANPSVDQASLPPLPGNHQDDNCWNVSTPIQINLNLDLSPKPSTMGEFALITACCMYDKLAFTGEPSGVDDIVSDMHTLLTAGARLSDFHSWCSSSELLQLFKDYK